MNPIVKTWRNFKIRVTKRSQGIVENKFKIGDWVVARDQQLDSNAGEVIDAFYGFDMNAGWGWHYKVSYKKRDTIIVLYEEQEICIDTSWIRDKKIKELGI